MRKVVFLALSGIILSANTSNAQNSSVEREEVAAMDTERGEAETGTNTTERNLHAWLETKEVADTKVTLSSAMSALDDPVFENREKATRNIMVRLETLAKKIYPFPAELQTALGLEILHSGKFGRDLEYYLMNKDELKYSAPKSRKINNIQEEWHERSIHYAPRILPGAYSIPVLRKLLELQTGIHMPFMQGNINTQLTISEEKNTWGDVLDTVVEAMGGGHLHFNEEENSLSLCADESPSEQTYIQGPNIYVVEKEKSGAEKTSVWRAPGVGSFQKRVVYRSAYAKPINLPSRPLGIRERIMRTFGLALQTDHIPDTCDRTILHRRNIIAPVGSRQVTNIPFGEAVQLGRLQTIYACKESIDGSGGKWRVSVKIDSNEEGFNEVEDINSDRLERKTLCENSLVYLRSSGKVIPHETTYHDRKNRVLILNEEPDLVQVEYTEDIQRVFVPRLNRESLPKK